MSLVQGFKELQQGFHLGLCCWMLPCCEQPAIEELVDRKDDGIGRLLLKTLLQPGGHGTGVAWLGIIILVFMRRCQYFYAADAACIDDELAAGGASIQWDEDDAMFHHLLRVDKCGRWFLRMAQEPGSQCQQGQDEQQEQQALVEFWE